MSHLEALRDARPDYRPDGVTLLLARAYAGSGRPAEAREAFERAVGRFGTFEAVAEYEIWALATGDAALAARMQKEVDRITGRWNALSQELNQPVLRRLKAAQQLAARPHRHGAGRGRGFGYPGLPSFQGICNAGFRPRRVAARQHRPHR